MIRERARLPRRIRGRLRDGSRGSIARDRGRYRPIRAWLHSKRLTC